MTTDIIELQNFIVLIEQSNTEKPFVQKCSIDREVVGFAFYGSGNVELEIKHNNQTKILTNSTGLAISFYGNSTVEFSHKIGPERPLQSTSIFAKKNILHTLPDLESEIFYEHLHHLMYPEADFVEGPAFYMTPVMQNVVQKIFNTHYTGNTRLMFLRSQVTELLAHYFAALVLKNEHKDLSNVQKDQLLKAKDIIDKNISKPPSLSELSKMIGLNNNKLKKNFKELFGVPVFKYLQEERLSKAYELLSNTEMGVQEVAWFVGYESISSFSNAFSKKFGTRPAEIKKQFFSNKS